MANLLFLAHRLPYPPNKGDKVRSYHLLKHLAARHRVFVGTFVVDPGDEQHVATVQLICAGQHVSRLHPAQARLRSLAGLLRNKRLTLASYRHASLCAWLNDMQPRNAVDRCLDAASVEGALR